MKFDIAENEMSIDMGTSGSLDLTITFTDQNCIDHSRTFKFRVFGEKPTHLTIASAEQVIFEMTERDKP